MERNEEGFIVGITPVGKSMCQMLHLDIRRTDLFWQINKVREMLTKLEILFINDKLSELEKDFYIKMNMLLNQYIDESFIKGE